MESPIERFRTSGTTMARSHLPCTAIRPRRTSGATYCRSWRAPVTAPSPPDLPGFGDSPADLPGTWEHQIDHLERFRRAVGIEQAALLVHDWGGLIGLRWACEHPDAVNALVIADTGFFPDGHWHGFAKSLKTEGEGEQIMDNMNRDLFALAMSQVSSGISDETIDEFYKAYSDPGTQAEPARPLPVGRFLEAERLSRQARRARSADAARMGC